MVLLSAGITAGLVALTLGSIRIAILSLLLPVLAFPLAWSLFALLSGHRTLGVTQTAGLFVVVGMGVDDIFVIAAAARGHARAHGLSRHQSVARALHTSGLAIAITSLTDAIAFSSNWATPIAAVREFGLFIGFLILVNFTLIVLAFPAIYTLFSPPAAPTDIILDPVSLDIVSAATIEETTELSADSSSKVPMVSGFLGDVETSSRSSMTNLRALGMHGILCLHHRPIAMHLITLVATVGAALSLLQLKLDVTDYRWAAFGADTNLQRVSRAYQMLGDVSVQSAGALASTGASLILDHPVWPAKEPMRIVWGNLSESTTGLRTPGVANVPSEKGRPLSEQDAPSLQHELARVCRGGSALPGVTHSACLGEHFARYRRALNLTYPVINMTEFSAALCQFGSLSFGDGQCDAPCASNNRQCIAFRATAPTSHPPEGWHQQLRWRRGKSTTTDCGELVLILAEFELGARAYDASGASLRHFYDAFANLLQDHSLDQSAQGTIVHEQLPQMRVEETLVLSTSLSSLAAFLAACGTVFAALGNARVTALVALYVAVILLVSLAAMVWMGWALGPSEAMMFTISAGLSIDFVLHIAIAYLRSPTTLSSRQRTSIALDELGHSVTQAAITTATAASFMVPLPLRPLSRFGIYIIVNQAISLFVAVGPFAAALDRLGVMRVGECCN
mmetsp:Transcript_15121/g.46137  ORF Transcript_15121/g.46137 Transcript_15121/m.46137 type:complete len:679 (-) Transcript_15121:123-2159(-)